MTIALSQPTTPKLSPELVREQFFLAQCTDVPDPLWHFELAVRKTAGYLPPEKIVPGPDKGQLIARFLHPKPNYSIEVFAQLWRYEVDAADFLDAWIEQRQPVAPMTVVARNPQPNPGGHVGDCIVTGGPETAQWAARIISFKYGPRMLVMSCRTALADYEQLADEFFVSIMTMRMLDSTPGVYAEPVRWIRATHPVNWRVAIPASVEAKPGPIGGSVGEFEAEVMGLTDAGTQAMGRLTYTLVSPDRVRDEKHAAENVQFAFRKAGVDITPGTLMAEPAAAPYLGSWLLVTPARLPSGGEGELRIRILRHPRAWAIGAVIGASREVSKPIWMRNKRLIDLVMSTLEVTG